MSWPRPLLLTGLAALAPFVLACGTDRELTGAGGTGGFGVGGAGGGGGGGEISPGGPLTVKDPPTEGGAGGGGGDNSDCSGDPQSGTLLATFDGELAPLQYVRAMLDARFVPAPEALAYGALREGMDDIEAPRFNAWLDYPPSGIPTLEVRRRLALSAEPIEQLVPLLDLSPSNASTDGLRRAVLRSLGRAADELGAELRVVGFAGEPLELGFADGGTETEQADVGAAEALAMNLEIPTSEGHNLAKAISALSSDTSKRAHIVVLTDGGFQPSEEALLAIRDLASAGERRLSIAQLSPLEGFAYDETVRPRTELRREMLAAVATAGRGLSLFLHDGELDCDGSGAPCMHAGVAAEFQSWFAASAPAPAVTVNLPAGIGFLDDEGGVGAGSVPWVPADATLALSVPLLMGCNTNQAISVEWEETLSLSLAPLEPTLSHPQVNTRLRDIVGAVRAQPDAGAPASSACAALQNLAGKPALCEDPLVGDAALCAYAERVEAFYDDACRTMCGAPCASAPLE